MESHTQRLDLAYSKLGLREPFIAAVMTRVKREVSDKVSTAMTNGSVVKYGAAFMDKITDEQLFGLVLHESCHVVLMHMWRREGRDPALWNYANDAIINAYIRARNYELPEGGVNLRWVRDEHSSEFVYDKLKEQKQQQQQQGGGKGGNGQDDGQGEPMAGGFDGTGDLEDAVDEATRTDMEATIVTAAKMAKDCGHGSALIDRILANTGKANVRWQDVLRSMMTESAAADYTYMRPSRRFIASGLYLPSLRTEALGGLGIGFDTSGSMGQEECDQIAAELQAIVDDLQPAFVEVVYCDYNVTHTERFERDELLELKPKGGGGTRFQPVFEHFDETGEHYAGIIYFTDMEGDLDECVEPPCPVIWANIGRGDYQAPFGTAVKVPL
jgi:predicted metal-dependent peptidase